MTDDEYAKFWSWLLLHESSFGMEPFCASQKRDVLDKQAPKVVDAEKYHGRAAEDFETIRRRMKEISND